MKNLLEYLNDVKIDLEKYDECYVNDIEKRQIKNKFKNSIKKNKKINKKVVIVALLFLSLLLYGNYEKVTSAIEKILSKNSVESFENYNTVNSEIYRTVINKSITDNGITITLNDIIFDYNSILITYTTEDGSIDASKLDPKIYINDKEIRRRAVSDTYSDLDSKLNLFQMTPMESYPLGENMDIKIIFGGFEYFEQDKVIEDGTWEFYFKANTNSMESVTKIIDENQCIKLRTGEVINLKKVISTPISTNVDISIDDIDNFNMSYVTFDILNKEGYKIDKIQELYSYNNENKKLNINLKVRNLDEKSDVIKVIPIINGEAQTENSFEINIK